MVSRFQQPPRLFLEVKGHGVIIVRKGADDANEALACVTTHDIHYGLEGLE